MPETTAHSVPGSRIDEGSRPPSKGRSCAKKGCLVVFLVCSAYYLLYCFVSLLICPALLRSLPAPPGLVKETDGIGAGAEVIHHTRVYEVEQPYLEVVGFFKEEFPKRGWRLVEESTSLTPRLYAPGDVASAELIFRGPYCLPLRISVEVVAGFQDETQAGRTRVFIFDPTWEDNYSP